jgi:hypothetical protein
VSATARAGEGDSAGQEPSIDRDAMFEMLSNQRRRFVLHYLQQNGERAELGPLAEQIAAWENGTTLADVGSDERKSAYTSLQQFHLPKMDEEGLVHFNDRAKTIELAEPAAEANVYLELVDDYDIPWSFYYIGLAAVGGLLLGGSAAGVPPFSSVPGTAWGVFLVAALAVSAVVHAYVTRRSRLGNDGPPPEV